jgi:hypothetical protein
MRKLSWAETEKAAVSDENDRFSASGWGEGRRTRTFNQRIKSALASSV